MYRAYNPSILWRVATYRKEYPFTSPELHCIGSDQKDSVDRAAVGKSAKHEINLGAYKYATKENPEKKLTQIYGTGITAYGIHRHLHEGFLWAQIVNTDTYFFSIWIHEKKYTYIRNGSAEVDSELSINANFVVAGTDVGSFEDMLKASGTFGRVHHDGG